MRTLIVGALAATLVGCSCYPTPQPGLEACAGADGIACLDSNSTARRWTVPELSSDASTPTPTKKAALRVATVKPLSAGSSGKTVDAGKAATSVPVAAKVEPAPAVQASEATDPVVDRAKIAVAAKLEDPKSASFSEMKRSMRKNLRGESLDTICGRVKSKKASGEDIGDRPFLYLVKDDVAFVADDSPSSADSTAHSAICN
jgi:hypothetical protein